MPKEYGRDRRVADFIQRELAVVLQMEMKDPRVGMVSITEVKVSSDLGYADIYVSSFDAEQRASKDELLAVLGGAAGWLRTLIAKRSNLRVVPRLRFHWDEILEQGQKIDRLIGEALASDKAQHAADAAASDDDRGED
ncbi:MAG TPA: 30S ribosome-binding factor RbfA [Pseudomonadales bacterium]|nr:30S ribosome-binding factor RbfA [Pseudomonadales bacterium]